MYVLTRQHTKNPNDGHGAGTTFVVQKVFHRPENAEAHFRYLCERFRSNGYSITQSGGYAGIPDSPLPRVLMTLEAYKDHEDECGTETYVYTITEVPQE